VAGVFITGSADGLGRLAAQTLIQDGHEVVVHARSRDRLTDVQALIVRGAGSVIGDLADIAETHAVARQVNGLGAMDAVIHNAGVMSGPSVLAVNVIAACTAADGRASTGWTGAAGGRRARTQTASSS
jgi:NADP-dependent 3-hydroxy acid dehydrogenase YdfG